MSKISEKSESLRITEASKQLGVSDGTMRKWVSKGIIKCIKLPSGERRFERTEIERMKNTMSMTVYCPSCKSYDVKVVRSDDRKLLSVVCSSCGKYLHLGKVSTKFKEGDIIPSKHSFTPSEQITITIPESTSNSIPQKYHGTVVLEGSEYGVWELLDKSSVRISDDGIEVQIYYKNGSITLDDRGITEIEGDILDGKSDKIMDVHVFRGHRFVFDLVKEDDIDVTPKDPDE